MLNLFTWYTPSNFCLKVESFVIIMHHSYLEISVRQTAQQFCSSPKLSIATEQKIIHFKKKPHVLLAKDIHIPIMMVFRTIHLFIYMDM